MEKKNSDKIDRRTFLKVMGAGTLTATAALTGCGDGRSRSTTSLGEGKMTYRENLHGQKVSLLGYGCMRWPTLPGNKNEYDQEMINTLVDTAIAHGVNYFDTSPNYCRGLSERITGIALSRHPRESYQIATKLSNFSPSTWSREGAMEMYHNSFKELQVDYIDYLLLHSIGGGGDAMKEFATRFLDNGMLDFLMEEREAGRIRNLGFSYHGDVRVFDYALANHDKYHWDFAQIQLNYLDWKHAKDINRRNTNAEYLYTELEKRHIPAVIMEPLLGGRLSKVNEHVAERLKQRAPDRSVASWAFRFAGSWPGVLTVLSGMTYMEHLEDNLKTYSPLQPLTEAERQFLFDTADLMMEYPTIPCNDCNYCMPCPYGLDIPGILTHYNKCINEGNIPTNPGTKAYREARRAFLVGYDRSVPRLRQAAHCIGCRQCEPLCPQNIAIASEMQKIDAFVERLKQE
ncbi:MAG: aldo/keto reductase [Porphyromonadaceae bacterium]|nr:aldo/keto reductase [Porphyromonadaceae bacterium]